jgi:hypothetical protein
MHHTLFAAMAALFPVAALAQSATSAPAAAPPPAASSAALSSAAPSDAQLIALGRQLTDWWYLGQADSIYSRMSEDSRSKMPKEEFLDQRLQILARIGGETAVVEEKMTLRKGNRQYWRESKVDAMTEEAVVMRWVFSPEGQVIGLGINPKSRAPAPD